MLVISIIEKLLRLERQFCEMTYQKEHLLLRQTYQFKETITMWKLLYDLNALFGLSLERISVNKKWCEISPTCFCINSKLAQSFWISLVNKLQLKTRMNGEKLYPEEISSKSICFQWQTFLWNLGDTTYSQWSCVRVPFINQVPIIFPQAFTRSQEALPDMKNGG